MTGTFVLSLDTELAWGSFDKNLHAKLVRAAAWENREGIPRLLDLLCRERISATWAFVGHVTLDRCSGHAEFEPVKYDWYSGDWFEHDPMSDESRHPEWYGRNCFLKVLRAPHPQEIAFHSFSHVVFGNPGTPSRRAMQEFSACQKIAREFRIRGDVFVYPRNRVGFLGELREAGFRTFRAPDVARFRTRHDTINGVWSVLADFFSVGPLPVAPYMEAGLVALPGSMMLRSMDGWRRCIPYRSRSARIMKGLERCIREGGVFHLWFHPINLYSEQEKMFELVEECMSQIGLLRDRGDLRVATMGAIADEYLASFVHPSPAPCKTATALC
jgi:hypothetical protein